MFLSLPDPDSLVRGADLASDPSLDGAGENDCKILAKIFLKTEDNLPAGKL